MGNCKNEHDYDYLILQLPKFIWHSMRDYTALLLPEKLTDGE